MRVVNQGRKSDFLSSGRRSRQAKKVRIVSRTVVSEYFFILLVLGWCTELKFVNLKKKLGQEKVIDKDVCGGEKENKNFSPCFNVLFFYPLSI